MFVILPLKDLVLAKQRLSGVLSNQERRGLFQAMVSDVLAALVASVRVQRVILLSDDPTAPLLAEHHGVDYWSEQEVTGAAGKGLNAALTAVAARLAADGVAEWMVIHGDLPLLSAADVDAFIDRHAAADTARCLTLNPDAAGAGTNVMALRPAQWLQFEYGSQSAELHAEQARECGAALAMIRLPGMQLDVDDVDDLLALLDVSDSDRAVATRAYLEQAGIDRRLRLIAASGAVNDHERVNTVQHFE